MQPYIDAALAGDWVAQVTVVTRPDLDPDLLAHLMAQPDLDKQVQLAIAERRDIGTEVLGWAAGSDSGVVLHRVIVHTTSPLHLVRAIRYRAEAQERPVWDALAEHADRVLARRDREEV
ncbi:hypothetical protein [Arthrobacter sp. GCM10027362]|uniref:hypothetical protein n=1 Tax=Arthrobacter sp. GCM10027362 TaxID=3273379 RepID=UPI00366FB72F